MIQIRQNNLPSKITNESSMRILIPESAARMGAWYKFQYRK